MKWLLTLCLIVLLVVLTIPVSSHAAQILGLDLKFTGEMQIADAIGFSRNSSSSENNPNGKGLVAGIFSGSVGGLYNEDGKKPIGFIGFTMYAASGPGTDAEIKWIPTFNPITFFNDTVHIDVGRNLNDEGMTIGFGLSGVEAVQLLWDFGSRPFTGGSTK